jgi:hypothetical protein
MLRILLLSLVFSTSSVFADSISIFASKTHSTIGAKTPDVPNSGYNLRKKISDLDFSSIPEWKSYDQIFNAFLIVRDTRFLKDPQVENFLRRISWLYHRDGCFDRAGIVARTLNEKKYPPVAQLFIFGGLYLKSERIVWNYHVAPAVRIKNHIYMLDASISPLKPILYQDWIRAFTEPDYNIQGSICSFAAWDTNSSCANTDFTTPSTDGFTLDEWAQKYWLPAERAFLREKANDYLGDNPPWLSK